MATPKTVWGIDIGKCALKALKLRSVEGELRLEAFDIIEHPRILSQPDADADVLTRNALEQFLARNNVSDSMVVIPLLPGAGSRGSSSSRRSSPSRCPRSSASRPSSRSPSTSTR